MDSKSYTKRTNILISSHPFLKTYTADILATITCHTTFRTGNAQDGSVVVSSVNTASFEKTRFCTTITPPCLLVKLYFKWPNLIC